MSSKSVMMSGFRKSPSSTSLSISIPPHLSPTSSTERLSERRPHCPSPPLSTPPPPTTSTRKSHHPSDQQPRVQEPTTKDELFDSFSNLNYVGGEGLSSSSSPNANDNTTETATIKIVRPKKGGLKKSMSVDSTGSTGSGDQLISNNSVPYGAYPQTAPIGGPSSSYMMMSSTSSPSSVRNILPPVLFDSEALKVAFNLFDQNSDGRVSLKEVRSLLSQLEGRQVGNGIVMDRLTIQYTIDSFMREATSSNVVNSTKSSTSKSSYTANGGHGYVYGNDDEFDEESISMSFSEFFKWMPSLVSKTTSTATFSTPSSSSSSSSSQLKSSHSTSVNKHTLSSSSTTTTGRLRKDSSSSGSNSNSSQQQRTSSLPTEQQLRDEEEDLRAAFALFDQDSNGFISKEELRTALRLLNEDDTNIDAILREVDVNQDGIICVQDFLSLFK